MNRTQTRTGLFLAISTLLACQGALAQSAPPPQPDTTQPDTTQPDAQTATPVDQTATQLDAVEVRGEYIPEPMLQTSEIASFVTREDFERTGDADAAAALTRVTGLSLVRDKYVYVRGLGERYSSALFNGSPLPSPEPLQRVVPLDLFPSEVLQSVTVQKTYSAEYSGEFGGGVIDLRSLTVPEEPFLTLSVGTGGNSVTTFEKGLTYYGSDTDYWGYDDGVRKIPGALQDAIDTGQRVDLGNFSREDIRRIGRSFQNASLNLLQQKDSIDPDTSFGGSAGYSLDMGEGRLGFLAVANFENEWRTRFGDEERGFFLEEANVVEFDSDYEFVSTRNNARVNVMLGTGYESDRHQIGLTTLYVHDTIKEARSRSGLDNLAGFVVRDDYTEWFERELVNNQITGSHAFGEYDDLTIEWRGAIARATRDAPYEKSIRYQLVDGYWAHDGSRVQNSTRFSNVEDDLVSGGVDVTWRLPLEHEVILSGGGAYSDNDRKAEQREFRFLALDGPLPFFNRYQRPDFLFSDFNLSQDLLRLRETTGSFGAAAYDATLKVKAVYLQVETEIVPLVRATFGVRYEDATQAVYPINIFTGERQDAPDPLRNDYFLPAATLTWNFAENQQIRFGASQTIARPQFRELAPQQYQDPDNNRQYYGNPFLVDSELLNLDARYEWFFGAGEYFTLGAFYKRIDKPIESNVNFAGGTTFQSFLNAPEATLYGVEVELKKYFDVDIDAGWWGDSRLYFSTNYTWSQSEVNAEEGDTVQPFGFFEPVDARLFVRDGSVLQGQSDHIANLQFGIESAATRTQATLIANYVSERVSARGRPPNQPDFINEPGTSLDFVLNKGFNLGGTELTLGFSARNLLDTEYQEYQERGGNRIDIFRYDPGISYSLSLSASF